MGGKGEGSGILRKIAEIAINAVNKETNERFIIFGEVLYFLITHIDILSYNTKDLQLYIKSKSFYD